MAHLQIISHLGLLWETAVVLDAQYEWVQGGLERISANDLDHVLELELGGESVSVVDERFPIRTIPAIQLNAPAAFQQGAAVDNKSSQTAHAWLC